jgi:catechol 2,3-dioxygenase-like lactoylglutathione lyase family enzyme
VKGGAFLVLSEHADKPVSGEPIKLDEVGIHHVGFWVEDLPAVHDALKAKGVEFVVEPTVVKVQDGTFHSAFLLDPDGILLQLDELIES